MHMEGNRAALRRLLLTMYASGPAGKASWNKFLPGAQRLDEQIRWLRARAVDELLEEVRKVLINAYTAELRKVPPSDDEFDVQINNANERMAQWTRARLARPCLDDPNVPRFRPGFGAPLDIAKYLDARRERTGGAAVPVCRAITKGKGERCTHKAQPGQRLCGSHLRAKDVQEVADDGDEAVEDEPAIDGDVLRAAQQQLAAECEEDEEEQDE